MQISGEEIIHAPREVVWQVLHDPELLKQCFKNCEALTRKSDHEFDLVIAAKLGPFKTTHHVVLIFLDEEVAKSCRITAEGQGHIAGYVRGTIDLDLSNAKEGTTINYRADVAVAASFSSFAATFIDSALNHHVKDFFERLDQQSQKRADQFNQGGKDLINKEKRTKPSVKNAAKKTVGTKKPAKAAPPQVSPKVTATKNPVKKPVGKKTTVTTKPVKKSIKKSPAPTSARHRVKKV